MEKPEGSRFLSNRLKRALEPLWLIDDFFFLVRSVDLYD